MVSSDCSSSLFVFSFGFLAVKLDFARLAAFVVVVVVSCCDDVVGAVISASLDKEWDNSVFESSSLSPDDLLDFLLVFLRFGSGEEDTTAAAFFLLLVEPFLVAAISVLGSCASDVLASIPSTLTFYIVSKRTIIMVLHE